MWVDHTRKVKHNNSMNHAGKIKIQNYCNDKDHE